MAGLDSLNLDGSEAVKVARSLGIPDALFVGLCEWLEAQPVESNNLGTRYAPNTRASALQWCKTLVSMRKVIGS